jgi:FixJ family two-component response regulator
MIVDDEPLVLTLLNRVLTDMGFQTLQAYSGPEALKLEASYSGTIDVLLTDLKMPGMSGQELTAEMLRRRHNLRVLYMSGFCDRAAAGIDALEGSFDFLQKPFSRATLMAKMSSVIPDAFWPDSVDNRRAVNI